MSICVDRESKEFKKLVEELDIHPNNLELVIHEFLNDESRTDNPTKQEILQKFTPKPFKDSAENIEWYLKKEHDKPAVFLDKESALKEQALRDSFYGKGTSILYRNSKGEFVVKTGLAVDKELLEIRNEAIANGTYLLAPNGNPTNLNERQWLQVRTKNFIKWFGDWINDPDNASKVVDENGEPMVVYHASNETFNVFNESYSKYGFNAGVFFSTSKEYAKFVSRGKSIYEAFLSIKNPIYTNDIEREKASNIYAESEPVPPYEWFDRFGTEEGYKEYVDDVNRNKIDGIIGQDSAKPERYENTVEYSAKSSNQIKSATSNTGEFSTQDDNIFNNKEFRGIYDVLSYIQKIKYSFKDPILGNVKKQIISKVGKTYYITKTDPEYAKQLLEIHRERLLLPKGIFKIETKGKNQVVTVDESVLEDLIERNNNSQAFEDLFSSAEEAEKVQDVLDFLSSKTGLNYQTISESEAAKLLKKRKGSIQNVNAFIHNNTCYFIQGRKLNVDIASEEMLHPFINAVYNRNPALFSNLLKEAKELFPRLHLEIAESYKNESQEVREQELVTQALSRAFREERKDNPKGRKLASIIDKFWNFVKELFGAGNKDYILADEINSNTTIQDLAKIINTDLKLVYNSKFGKITRMNNYPSSINIHAGTGENAHDNRDLFSDDTTETSDLPQSLSTFEAQTQQKPQQTTSKVETFSGNWSRAEVATQSDKVFLFGDNTNDRVNTHYVPSATQAVIRGLPNAIGIDTKKNRGTAESSYFTDADFDTFKAQVDEAIQQAVNSGKTIVIPEGGIGTGKAQLEQRAPKLFNYLQEQLNKLQRGEIKPTEESLDNTIEGTDIQDENEEQDIIEISEENKAYMEKTERINQQLDALNQSTVLLATEVRDISEQMVFWISDFITRIQSEPDYAVKQFGESYANKDFSKMSRVEIATTIGVENLLARCREQFKPRAGAYKNLKTIAKARQIYNNFEAIMFIASDVFTATENFSINLSKDGSSYEVNENLNEDNDNFNDPNSEYEVKELEGDLQEHWQIETKTRDVLDRMASPVRRMLRQCILKDKDGNTVYSEFGIARRVNIREATNSILKWTQGAITLEDMVEKLNAKADKHPWLKDIIEKLSDKSGKYTDLQGQFFGDFCKHFQSYYVVIEENGEFKSIPVNEEPALSSVYREINAQYKAGVHNLFGLSGVNETAFNDLEGTLEDLKQYVNAEITEDNIQEVSRLLSYASTVLGHTTTPELVSENLDTKNFKAMYKALAYMVKDIKDNLNNSNYTPFNFKSGGDIVNNLKSFLRPITQSLEDTTVASIYNNGKMYQSYITPSYTTKLFHKFSADTEKFEEFIEKEYGEVPFFKNPETGRWRNEWIKEMVKNPASRELFKHKVQLNFNRRNYMKDMNDMEYTVSVITEYFAESHKGKGGEVPAWFRVPMLSNKPSSEFIRFVSYRGSDYKDILTSKFNSIFRQELDRIQTVMTRNLDKTDPDYIENFDKNGRKFVFMDFMNDYLPGKAKADTELGKLIKDYLEGNDVKEMDLNTAAKKVIKEAMEARAQVIVATFEAQGVSKAAKKIANAGKTKEEIRENLINFVWNDTFAAMNIMQLTITDPAYYKHAEDLQKRLAQIHAPGVRGLSKPVDYNGKPVTDGKFRTIKLTDFENVISNVIDNITEVFDRKIANAPKSERSALEALKESLVGKEGAFRKINVADAQGYSCPTSYRKKAFRFGRWSKEAEGVWERLREGTYTHSDLQMAFQPLKPFVYSQVIKETGAEGAKHDKIKVPVQFKNSEYLLILADAILQGEETSKPNLLRAIYKVMEDSHFDSETGEYKTDGIDTIQFESTTKSGKSGAIHINDLVDKDYGEAIAMHRIESAIYKAEGGYTNAVDEIPEEDYCLQQEVPAHFKNHHQVHGSQGRYIIPSELESVNADGTPVTYTIIDPKSKDGYKTVTAQEFKQEYENTIAENIQESIDTLTKELHLEGFDFKNRNIAISRILQKEILGSPRYGVDLLQACSVNKNGKFRIPLGDPIQSKRVEQLLTSIVKNRVNKQEIAGGPVVQVSNFGTSRQLSIRYKDKVTGEVLKSKEEWENNKTKHSTYEEYIKEHQGGIAYFECFAPIYVNELFSKFADKDGNIDIQTIEDIDPDLLKMVGYRIPTEDKYSMAPLKIVGFLPREAGDGIMLPYDITTLSGSDFDVDKLYLMVKEIMISARNTKFNKLEGETLEKSEEEYIAKHKQQVVDHIIEDLKLRTKLSQKEIADIEDDVKGNYKLREMAEKRRYEQALKDIESRFAHMDELNEKALEESSKNSTKGYLDKKSDRIDRDYDRAIAAENKKHENRLVRLKQSKENAIAKRIDKAIKRKLEGKVKDFLSTGKKDRSAYDDALMRDIRRSYYRYMYHTVYPTSGREYRNNKIVDMTYEVLTHETSADKVLNPGGFDPQKKMGYMVSVYRNSDEYTWEQLEAMSIDELKDLSNTDKNLAFIDTHVQFYKQNAAAGSLIGIFAVHRTAHAVLESGTEDGSSKYKIDVDKACKLKHPFTILGMEFGGKMPFDMRYDRNGQLLGKSLGSLVASSADAVKDPVLNLMNINGNTANILTTLVRMGMPFDDAALFLSQSAISDILATYSKENITSHKSFIKVINERLDALRKEHKISLDSEINTEELTREELIKGLKPGADAKTEYKVLLALSNLSSVSKALRLPTFATRFNSSSGSPGPLMIDNLITEYTMSDLNDNSCIVTQDNKPISMDEIFEEHPILNGFKEATFIANELLSSMPANSRGFRNILDMLSGEPILNTLLRERKILSSLSDFYQSYVLMQNGVIDEKDLNYYISDFPKEFKNENIKEKYKDNLLIQAIRFTIDKNNRLVLSIDTTGLDTQAKEKLSAAWTDLHKVDPELSIKLFKYNFFKGGIGFNPKTFMNLLPIQVKEKIPGYVDTYRRLPATSPGLVFDQFIRNNWHEDRIVPRKKTITFTHLDDGSLMISKQSEVSGLYGTSYFKVKMGNEDKLYKITERGEGRNGNYVICEELKPLGSNRDYLEMSTEYKDNPLHIPAEAFIEDDADSVGKDGEVSNPTADDFHDEADSSSDNTDRLNKLLYDIFVIEGKRTEEEAMRKIKEFEDKSDAEKARLMAPMKKFFANRLDKLGVEFNEQLLNDLYKLLCS